MLDAAAAGDRAAAFQVSARREFVAVVSVCWAGNAYFVVEIFPRPRHPFGGGFVPGESDAHVNRDFSVLWEQFRERRKANERQIIIRREAGTVRENANHLLYQGSK